MISIIVAVAKNNVIGKNNQLIWHLPEDLKRFKALTYGHTILMGKNTFVSLGRVLPNRKHIVLYDKTDFNVEDENVEIVHSLDDFIKYRDIDEEVFVIGGAMVYGQMIDYAEKLYITEIDEEFDGDVYFPKIDKSIWKEVEREKGIKNEKNNLDYDFVTYIRK